MLIPDSDSRVAISYTHPSSPTRLVLVSILDGSAAVLRAELSEPRVIGNLVCGTALESPLGSVSACFVDLSDGYVEFYAAAEDPDALAALAQQWLDAASA
ncbi:hypothetical protein [Aestuariimicrobium sp. Y1814]|uniref:hypothetical protein n=1 Tax=Aestuariimicrobium sp. Y1814 TaxID=3418742 RepID=UPI003DA77C3A